MVKVEKLGVFLSSINAFFAQIDGSEVSIDTPYLNHNKSAVGYDYSGVIEISGPLEGCVYVSAPSVMLREVIKVMGEPDSSITMICSVRWPTLSLVMLVLSLAQSLLSRRRILLRAHQACLICQKIAKVTSRHLRGVGIKRSLVSVSLNLQLLIYSV